MAVKFSNNAATLLAANATTSDTTLTVSDGSVFPTLSGSDHTYVTLEDVNANREIVKVTARSGNNLTVVRAQDGTTARAFSAADKCELRVIAALLNDLNTDADTESVSKSGDTMTGNLSLGDNVKLQLGNQTDGDLQLYHDGSNSYITDAGTGSLIIDGSTSTQIKGSTYVILRSSAGENMAVGNANGAFDLFYNGSKKFATTSSGISVTGSVVADGLTVDGTGFLSTIGNNTQQIRTYVDADEVSLLVDGSARLDLWTGGSKTLRLASNGDISFYNDSAAQAFFFDSSTSRLGLGVTNPSYALDVDTVGHNSTGELLVTGGNSASNDYTQTSLLRLRATSINPNQPNHNDNSSVAEIRFNHQNLAGNASSGNISFYTNPSNNISSSLVERLTINADGSSVFSGAVTADGLTVDGNNDIQINRDGISSAKIFWNRSGTTDAKIELDASENLTIAVDEAQLGSKSLVFKNNNASALTIDSSQNVNIPNGKLGVGFTTVPSAPLHVVGSGRFDNSASTSVRLHINNSGSNDYASIYADTATAYKNLVLNPSGGNVGIGTDLPIAILQSNAVAPTYTNASTVFFGSTTNNTAHNGIMLSSLGNALGGSVGSNLTYANSGTPSQTNTNRSSGEIQFGNTTTSGVTSDIKFGGYVKGSTTFSEKMRLSGGNLLVGTTDTTLWNDNADNYGHNILGHGQYYSSTNGEINAYLNRQNSDGAILALAKDGSPVGSINAAFGFLSIGNADTGLLFDGTSETIKPWNVSNTSARDAAINLGGSSDRFKDLYLSSKTLYQAVGGNQHSIGVDANDLIIRSETAGSETARFTYGGNLLLGTTDVDLGYTDGDTGVVALPTGLLQCARDSQFASLYLQKLNNDGDHIEFGKDGTKVGSIGVSNTDLYIGSTDHGIKFHDTSNAIMPWIPSSNSADSSGTLDLGTSLYKFKDLYLSGTASMDGLTASTSGNQVLLLDSVSGATSIQMRTGSGSINTFIKSGIGGSSNLKFETGSADALTLDASQNVNIPNGGLMVGSTTVPDSIVHIKKNQSSVAHALKLENSAGGNNTGFDIDFQMASSGLSAKIGVVRTNSPAAGDTDMFFSTSDNGSTPTERLRIKHDGSSVFSGEVSAPALDLTAIAQSKSDTAVDVFVYDTSKDSDGGAWRHRTQGTSWYNETLNTSTRGATKKFPAVAVIVVEAAQVTIYDGDDPDMPMWKSIGVSGDGAYTAQTAILGSGGDVTSVSALNGLLSIGSNTGATGTTSMNGLTRLNFIADYVYGTNATYTYKWLGSLGDTATQAYWTNLGTGTAIVNLNINDVAMTVLPNAPIDADTGLPVPTIAVATNGGVSVVKDDGTVVDITNSHATYVFVSKIVFDEDNRLYFVNGNNGPTISWVYMFKAIPSADNVITLNTKTGSTMNADAMYDHRGITGVAEDLVNLGVTLSSISGKGFGSPTGLTFIAPDDVAAKGSVAYIASDYNTGWMNGDIKLATLSDTDDTNVTGSELVTNGTFSNTTGWSGLFASISVVSGKLRVDRGSTHGSSNGNFAVSPISCIIGRQYRVTYTQSSAVNCSPLVRIGVGNNNPWSNLHSTGTTGTHSFNFVATQTTHYFYLGQYSTAINSTIDYDDVSVQLLEEDRSVNGNGLQVFGTVTKTAVATGADLVAYSGFSSSNYLQQPYNSDLDFGIGDFSCAVWAKLNSTGNRCVYHRGSGYSGSWGTEIIQLECTTTNLSFNFSDNGFSTSTQVNTPIANLPTGVWNLIHTIRRGTTFELWINGVLKATNTSTMDLSNTAAKLWVGERPYGSRPWVGSLGLMRWSATAPTAEQIAKMYRDEKHLFQENAQATLYGTSDAVTALAYDDDTELLHAGTSAGRSVFQGLRRVDNTTDAVGAAISASNGLVAED